jgi:hypothetical protein
MPKIQELFKKFSILRFLKMQNTQRLPMKFLSGESLLKEPLVKESCLREPVVIEDPVKEEPTAVEPAAAEPAAKESAATDPVKESLSHELVSEEVLKVYLSKESTPEAPHESGTITRTIPTRKHPKATAQNNRLLRLPIELRLQIYDELLAIPRTIHMLKQRK